MYIYVCMWDDTRSVKYLTVALSAEVGLKYSSDVRAMLSTIRKNDHVKPSSIDRTIGKQWDLFAN